MPTTIITVEDLENFKQELLVEIKKLFAQRQIPSPQKWLKSHEIRRLLKLSPGTLQTLRVNGTLPFSKIGGIFFYNYEDIEKMLLENKGNRDFPTRKNNPWRNV